MQNLNVAACLRLLKTEKIRKLVGSGVSFQPVLSVVQTFKA